MRPASVHKGALAVVVRRIKRDHMLGNCKVGDEAEMVTGPYSVDRFVKDPLAGGNFECGTSMLPTAHEDVIDPSERPVPIGHQRVVRRKGVARFSRMCALPSITIADAHLTQGLTARPEADTT